MVYIGKPSKLAKASIPIHLQNIGYTTPLEVSFRLVKLVHSLLLAAILPSERANLVPNLPLASFFLPLLLQDIVSNGLCQTVISVFNTLTERFYPSKCWPVDTSRNGGACIVLVCSVLPAHCIPTHSFCGFSTAIPTTLSSFG